MWEANAGVTKTGGNYNTFLGYNTGANNSTGSNNTFIGHQTGYLNTGSGSVFLGYQAGQNETASNKLYIANSSTSTPLIKGTFPNTDLTFKATTITADGRS
jgi:trimeric autotransporter adhesin